MVIHMGLKQRTCSLIVGLGICTGLSAQEKFSETVLWNPTRFEKELLAEFTIVEIPEFDSAQFSTEGVLFLLPNDYRSSTYSGADNWLALRDEEITVLGVDIVYSKYPLKKGVFNENEQLLASRLRELFEIDALLNTDELEWRLVRQTNCGTETQVDALFHGVVIHYLRINRVDEVLPLADANVRIDNLFSAQESDSIRMDRIAQINLFLDIPDTLLSADMSIEAQETALLQYLEAVRPDSVVAVDSVYLETKSEQLANFIRIYGGRTSDNVVSAVLDRNPQWNNILVVADWTGSMYGYGAQVLEWHVKNFERSEINYFTLFNDGDHKIKKIVGETGGIYMAETYNLEKLILLYNIVMLKGGGGDGPENDLEAVLEGMHHYPDFGAVVLIADNNACVRDMSLLTHIDVPVHVILCGYTPHVGANPQYVEIAIKTGGSVHTIQDDILAMEAEVSVDKIEGVDGDEIKIGTAPCYELWSARSIYESLFFTDWQEALKNKKEILHLNLSGQDLRFYHTRINGMRTLETLDLSNNRIKHIPSGIGNLRSLKSINLSNNQIDELPEELADIAYLLEMDLSNNKLTQIPTALLKLNNLINLNLNSNELTAWPEVIGLKSLQRLYLADNNFQSLPSTIGRFKQLEELDLSHNKLTALPSAIGSLKNLVYLDLSFNELTDLPKSIVKLRRLKILKLEGNPINKKTIERLALYLPETRIEG